MKITIDNAGRVVIPKPIRERHHMRPGTELEIENEADGISLKVSGKKPSLIEKRGILVHHGGDTVRLDMADFINREREQRTSEIATGDVVKNSEAEYLDK